MVTPCVFTIRSEQLSGGQHIMDGAVVSTEYLSPGGHLIRVVGAVYRHKFRVATDVVDGLVEGNVVGRPIAYGDITIK